MASSLLGLDFEAFRTLIVDHYRATPVLWPGDNFDEPQQTGAGSPPTDWIVADILRVDSTPFNVENQQERAVRIVIYGAFQPNRGNLVARIDAIHAGLLGAVADPEKAALSLVRSTNSNTFTDSFSFVGAASPPPGMETKLDWLWRAWFTDSINFQQVA